MFKRIKQLFENLAYTGLKPQSGGASDPLYLSNRTLGQKLRAWSLVGIPIVVVLAGLGLVLFGFFDKDAPIAPPPAGISNAEMAQKMLPDLNQDLHVETQHDLEVEDVHVVVGSPSRLVGLAKNNSGRQISHAELVFDLTDRSGSRQGAVSTELKNIASKSSVPFQFAIESSAATFALVREVHVQ
jgi:hypothetical protein